MYEYRRMSPEEKQAIVDTRRKQQRPLHKPPHLKHEASWYLISAATYEHRSHFESPREMNALEQQLLEKCSRAKAHCAGRVVMPNHYHLLVDVEDLAYLGRCLGLVHGRSSRYANRRDGRLGRQVWYKYSDRKVRSERHFWTCLHYIIMNPVKHGLVDHPSDWPWSSIHELLANHGREWIEGLRRDYPLRDFGKGWDEYEIGS